MEECKHPEDRVTHQNKARTRFKCLDCGKWFNHKNHPYSTYVKPIEKAPRVLLFDLETAPLPAWVFAFWGQNIGMHQMTKGNELFWIITWSAKWLFDSKVMSGAVTAKEAVKRDDSRIVRQLWDLFNEADIIIAHNAKGFDIKHSNTRFFMNGMMPPTPYQVIDTLLEARKNFKLPHNKLDFLAQVLGIEMKKETSMELWIRCLDGEQEALDYMQKYNEHDVDILEEVYVRLRPWIKNHPNFNLYNGSDTGCSTCGEPFKNMKRNGSYMTNVNKYNSYQCSACGGSFSRTGKSDKKSELRSIAK